MRQVEFVVHEARDMSNSIIEMVSGTLLQLNLIPNYSSDSFLDVKILLKALQEHSATMVERIELLSKLDRKHAWKFLVKPHSQWLVLWFLSNDTSHMLLSLKTDIFII